MNTYELVTETMTQCRFDPTDTEDRAEITPMLLVSINEAYRKIVRENLRLWTTEEVTLDENGCFSASALNKRLVTIREITATRKYTGAIPQARFEFYQYDGNGAVYVHGAKGNVWVEYEYMPARLEMLEDEPGEDFEETETNTPQIDEDWHIILTYWAAHKYYASRGPNYVGLSGYWKAAYEDAAKDITTGVGETEQFKNVYKPL